MGEIADAMLDGSLCQGCGEYLGGGDGFPVLCAGCAPSDRQPKPERRVKRKSPKQQSKQQVRK